MFFDGSWWKWGDRKLQEGEGGMSPILALDWGVEAIAPPREFLLAVGAYSWHHTCCFIVPHC